ncbi:MAG TPA: putative glycolipid-binding domain-containing protein [Pyrinomonadaceae bacterium]
MWSHLALPGMEHFRIVISPGEIVADGIVLGIENDLAFRLRYEVRCDPQWRVRRVEVNLLSDGRNLSLSTNGEGRWFDESGRVAPALDGCLDVDITATPFTNTLPIRRLALKRGESADIKVAYVTIPELRVTLDEQRYTYVEAVDTCRRYRFEQRGSGFKATLEVDAEGLVKEYPALFRRVWASSQLPPRPAG